MFYLVKFKLVNTLKQLDETWEEYFVVSAWAVEADSEELAKEFAKKNEKSHYSLVVCEEFTGLSLEQARNSLQGQKIKEYFRNRGQVYPLIGESDFVKLLCRVNEYLSVQDLVNEDDKRLMIDVAKAVDTYESVNYGR